MKKVELLSPAGNMECLISAVQNGADAVYLGGKKFGARAFANNFDGEEMIKAIKYCHLYGVKIYVTVNTLVYDSEMKEALEYVSFLHKNGVDALIVQDIGLIRKIRQTYPTLELHASTQCHNHSKDSVLEMKKLGVKRVVLARELSLEEIKNIDVDIEKEVFVHGALCVSYSGCCLFSSMNGGRSGNRGECTGCCRLPYKLIKNGKELKTNGDYLLSTRSLCTITKIKELIESGITSFKIEGRMKSPEYTGYITRIYKEKIDNYYNKKNINVSAEEIDNIKKLYNRKLTLGYLFGEHGKNLMNIETSNHIGLEIGKVIYVDSKVIKIKLDQALYQEDGIRFGNDKGMIVNKLYDQKMRLVNKIEKGNIAVLDNKIGLEKKEIVKKTQDILLTRILKNLPVRKVKIKMNLTAKIGETLTLEVSDGKNKVIKYGNIVEKAQNSPTTNEKIKAQIEKLGNTPFICESLELQTDKNIFIGIKDLNDLRRACTEELITLRENYLPSEYLENKEHIDKEDKNNYKNGPLSINLLVTNEDQLKTVLKENVGNIYVEDYNLYLKYMTRENVYYKLNRLNDGKKNYDNKNLLITELGALKYTKNNNVISDYFLNVTNTSTLEYLLENGVNKVTISPEKMLENIEAYKKYKDSVEVYIYGRVELMVMKYCPLNMLINNDNKKCSLCLSKDKYSLKDAKGNFYPIKSYPHLTHILHYKPINLLEEIRNLKMLNISNFRVELYDEQEKEIISIIKEIKRNYE